MLPAKFLLPWDILEIYVQGLQQLSSQGNRYNLVLFDQAGKFLFTYSLSNKEDIGVAQSLLDLLVTCGLTQSSRSDDSGELTAKVQEHTCHRLRASLDYRAADHTRRRRAVERRGIRCEGVP